MTNLKDINFGIKFTNSIKCLNFISLNLNLFSVGLQGKTTKHKFEMLVNFMILKALMKIYISQCLMKLRITSKFL